jgi:phosphatidate phosphatase APP1
VTIKKKLTTAKKWAKNIRAKNPIQIVPYLGYGCASKIYIKGRVLEDKKVSLSTENDSRWRNFRNAWKRFESDEIPGARVCVLLNDISEEIVTDSEGYFDGILWPSPPLSTDRLWHQVQIELLSPQYPSQGKVFADEMVMVPPHTARFGVISDMDDTVIQTNATSLLRMAKNVLLGNARTRMPFKGVAAFYQALHEENGKPSNPLFYVSSSPWNLYDLLIEFFQIQNIPLGPLLLRDWSLRSRKSLPHKHRDHKLNSIRHILDLVDDLPFILIGDSGQKDPEIYLEILSMYPKRILAIYIRNVSRDLKRPAAIRELAKKVIDAGSTLILTDDTLAAAKHAIEQGWITADHFPEIVAQKIADEKKEPVIEKVLKKSEAPTIKVEAGQDKKSEVDKATIEKQLKEKPA